ncbi:MAG: hypothetical protein V4581_03400 [Bacteroidota bacterium]
MKKLLYIALLALPLMATAQETGGTGAVDVSGGSGVGHGIENNINKERLAGREVIERPITPALTCEEYGAVVVSIIVDRTGKVLEAEMTRGTTNAAPCLIEYAKSMAMATKFTAAEDAPEKQVGTISYNFKKTE